MSVKRRDKKNRILHDGESQRTDGRYAYKYIDIDGKAKFVYSWKLVDTDTVPQGKRDCVALRTKEDEIAKRLNQYTSKDVAEMTVAECLEKYFDSKYNIKESSRYRNKSTLATLKKEEFCYLKISDVTTPKAKRWMVKMNGDGKSYKFLSLIKGYMYSMFSQLIEEEYIIRNPFEFKLSKIVRNNTKKRVGLTPKEEASLLEYLKTSRFSKYYDEVYFLLNTGLRISEFCGLTLSDLDFENELISVNHQLYYIGNRYCVDSLKTTSGERKIPMDEDLNACAKRIIAKRRKFNQECVVDGVSGFICLTCHNRPTVEGLWASRLKTIVKNYNEEHDVKLTNITPHMLRHTYCSKLVKNGVSLKTVQYLMGHASVNMSLNVYAHVDFEDVKNEMQKKTT